MDLKNLGDSIKENLDKFVIMSGLYVSKLEKAQTLNTLTAEYLKKNAIKKLLSVNEILTSELNILEKSCHYFGMDENTLEKTVTEVLALFAKSKGTTIHKAGRFPTLTD